MLLARLDLRAFGKFTDVSLDLSARDRNFHLIYGPNEAGKSTSLRAIASLLFGMESNTDDCFQHRPTDIRVGGVLFDVNSGNRLECVRRRGRKQTLRDSEDRDPIDPATIGKFLDGVNRETFQTRFGLSYEALVEGGQAIVRGGGDLGEILFAAGAGVGQLRKIQDSFESNANALFSPRATKAEVNAALKQLEDDRKRMKELLVPNTTYERLKRELAEHQAAEENRKERKHASMRKLDHLKACRKAVDLIPSWKQAKEQLAEYDSVPDLSDDFMVRRHSLQTELQIAKAQESKLKEQLITLQQRLERTNPDDMLLQHDLEITRAFQILAVHEKSEKQLINSRREMKALNSKVEKILKDVTVNAPNEWVRSANTEDADEDGAGGSSDECERIRVNASLLLHMRDLAQQHNTLAKRVRDSSDLTDVCRRKISEYDKELAGFSNALDPSSLSLVLESIGKPELHVDALNRQREVCEKSKRLCRGALSELTGFSGDLDAALAIALPSQDRINKMTQAIGNSEERLRVRMSAQEQKSEQLQQLLQELETLVENKSLPSDREVAQARSERDEIVSSMTTSPLTRTIGEADLVNKLGQAIKKVDDLLDQRFVNAEQILTRNSLERRRNRLQSELEEDRKKLNEAQATHQKVMAEWETLWTDLGIVAGSGSDMERWRDSQQKLRLLADEMATEERRLHQFYADIKRDIDRLREALDIADDEVVDQRESLQPGLFDPRVEDQFISLWDHASEEKSNREFRWREMQLLRQKRLDQVNQLPEAEVQHQSAMQDLQKWGEDWKRTGVAISANTPFDAAATLVWLEDLSELNQLLSRRDELAQVIRDLQEDQDSFLHSTSKLVGIFQNENETEANPLVLVQKLYQRLQSEKELQQVLKRCEEELRETSAKHADAETQLVVATNSLKQLCIEAGAEQISELPELENQSRVKKEWLAKFETLNEQLIQLSIDSDLDTFVYEASSQSMSIWDTEIEQEELQQQKIAMEHEEAFRAIGAVENELSKIDGDAKAFDLRQQMEMVTGKMRDDVELYLVNRIGYKILQRAIEHYRNENQSPVLTIAQHYFCELTCGEYVELRPDYDSAGKVALQALHRSGDTKLVKEMSTGTADSLYLALRLASLQHQMEHGTTMPVVIDDCLIQLDDDRSMAALRALSELSAKTQVILFTHHQHLVDLATSGLGADDVKVHQLGA